MPKTLLNLCTVGPCPSPADDLPGFLTWHRSMFGALRMEGDGDGGDAGEGDDGGAGDGDDDGKDDAGDKPPAEPPALVEERTARKNAETILSELLPGKSKAEIRKALKAGTLDALRPAPPKNDKGGGKDSEEQVDVEQIKRDATRDATEKANARIVSSEVRALAAELFEDPSDAPLYLDLSKYDVDDDGNVDAAEIKADLKKLIESKKHLAKKAGRPKPDKTQGAKADAASESMPGRRRMAAAYADSGAK